MINTLGKILLNLVVLAIAFAFMLAAMKYTFFIPLFILSAFIIIIFAPSNKKKFFKLEERLPTSKIRSVAMGSAEIQGVAKIIDPIQPKIKLKKKIKKKCIGYLYRIETISRDSDGSTNYKTIHTETIINDFKLKDETGEIYINASDLEFIDFPVHIEKIEKGKRYQQSILMENNKIMIIGEVARVNKQVVMRRDVSNAIFSMAQINNIKETNKMKPLYSSLTFHVVIALVLIAIVLLMDINLDNNQLQFSF